MSAGRGGQRREYSDGVRKKGREEGSEEGRGMY